jgi:hypothetical protein
VNSSNSTYSLSNASSTTEGQQSSEVITKSGRPKGTTIAKKYEDKMKLCHALNYVASNIKEQKEQAQLVGTKAKYGSYNEIVKRARVMFDIPEDIPLKKRCLQRVSKPSRNVVVAHRRKVSPMLEVEAHLADIIIQAARIRQPITPKIGIALANSLVKGSIIEKEVLSWRAKSLPSSHPTKLDPEYEVEGDILGKDWWRNFLKRSPSITSKKAVRCDSLREDWCSEKNFEIMYSEVYEVMVDSRVAIKLDEEVHVDVNGNIVQENGFGRKNKYLVTKPNYILYVDEVGDNTSQINYGNVGGAKILVAADERALIWSSYSDTHFTVLGFTAGNGNPVCCVIILAGSELKANHVMGLQPWVEAHGDVTVNLEENSGGLDKFYPFGPVCNHNGHEISTYVTVSENGSITADILLHVMKHLDTHLAWNREEATPFVLLDGHGSHFGLEFLCYINKNDTKWTVCLGVPYGTHLWQVGDSAEQNGAFKMALVKAKQQIINEKSKLHLPCKLERHDVVGLVHRAWNKSFARVDSNKKAIANRGWGPLTYNLLDHPELKQQNKKDIVEAAYNNCRMSNNNQLIPRS